MGAWGPCGDVGSVWVWGALWVLGVHVGAQGVIWMPGVWVHRGPHGCSGCYLGAGCVGLHGMCGELFGYWVCGCVGVQGMCGVLLGCWVHGLCRRRARGAPGTVCVCGAVGSRARGRGCRGSR